MQYPIFNSIIKKIQSELQKRDISTKSFRVWKDDTIHATGLEMSIDVSHLNSGIKQVTLNFDWDKFREGVTARTLEGMDKHPLLNESYILESRIVPTIDIEISWTFDEDLISNSVENAANDARLHYASSWMKAMNAELSNQLSADKTISRWHLEVEADTHGKFVSSMCFINYNQYSLNGMRDLNEIHNHITSWLQNILLKSKWVLELAGKTRPAVAA